MIGVQKFAELFLATNCEVWILWNENLFYSIAKNLGICNPIIGSLPQLRIDRPKDKLFIGPFEMKNGTVAYKNDLEKQMSNFCQSQLSRKLETSRSLRVGKFIFVSCKIK